jgi:hypothetical protein
MNISPSEAEESLTAIQEMVRKTQRSISSSGAYQFLIIWGCVWLVGFLGSQFLPAPVHGWLWLVADAIGGALSAFVGIRMGRQVRNPAHNRIGKKLAIFWLLLFLYCVIAVAVAWPVDGKQASMFIILFVMVGWLAMSLLLSFSSIWFSLAITAISLAGYFLLPGYFYLWMAILGGGGMIALGLYIRWRW